MADSDYFTKKPYAPFAKKFTRKYGKDFFREIGLKGWEKRKQMMRLKTQEKELNK